MKIFLTGKPGSGKSTILMKIVEILKNKGMKVGGFITPDIREKGRRIGFKVVDINSDEEGILSSVNQKTGPRVGKYRVNLEDFERVAFKALDHAVKECDVLCIDELGKMELFSEKFKEKIENILKLDKLIIIVLHRNLVRKYEKYGKIFYVTPENRSKLPEKIIQLIENGSTQS